MNLISPQNFLFAGLIGIIVLLYVLRLKRREHVVASTMLWQSALRDLPAPWPRATARSRVLVLWARPRRRREPVVASTMLWQSALRDLQANSPWQKLRSSLLRWLQIA